MKIKHIVLLKCREDVTEAEISEIFEDLKIIKWQQKCTFYHDAKLLDWRNTMGGYYR